MDRGNERAVFSILDPVELVAIANYAGLSRGWGLNSISWGRRRGGQLAGRRCCRW